MRITSLVENTLFNEICSAEHGLSLYIEAAGHKILFDMGQSGLFAENAEKLGIDLTEVDIAFLSHGHYDHGGGLKTFLSLNKKAPVYLNRNAFGPQYRGDEKYIGLDQALKENERLVFVDDFLRIDESLSLYSCNDRERKHDLGSFGLTQLINGEYIPDDFKHEQYLLIEENGKRVLISGCSHKGVMDITEWFRPDTLIGGFHYNKLSLDENLTEYAEFLNSFDTDFYTCHCTGEEQFHHMEKSMNRLHYLATGQTIEL